MHWLSLKELLSWNPLQIKNDHFNSAKIRFDNAFRFWISTTSILVLFLLRMADVIPTFLPVLAVFGVYAVVQLSASWLLRTSRHPRRIDFVVCGVDMLALSLAVYWTGGAASPLYFIYFVPLIIQAFHRDWVLILYYGFGGVTLYSAAVLFSVTGWTPAHFVDLGARLFFMLMTVSVAAIAVSLLRKRDELERVRYSRMTFLTQVTETLAHVNMAPELPSAVEQLVHALNEELEPQLASWSRVFLSESDSHFMKAYADPENDRPELARELASATCPVMAKGNLFHLEDAVADHGCPTESFAFGSHLCLPIAGSDGETHGVLFTGSIAPKAFQEEDAQFLSYVATAIGLTVQRLNRIEDLEMITEMNSCVMAAFVGSTHGLPQTYDAILEGLAIIVQVEEASLMLTEPATGKLKTVLARGRYAGQEQKLVCQFGEGIPGKVLETGESILKNEFGEASPPFPGPTPYKSWLAIPLRSMKGEPLGVLNAWSFKPFQLISRRLDMAQTFATRAAVAVENALEREKMKKSQGENSPSGDVRRAA